jgi:hypothetical protein
MPAEWQVKAELEYRKYANKGRVANPERVRFVTYTPRYGECEWVEIEALQQQYVRAMVDGVRDGDAFTLRTTNVRLLTISPVSNQEGPFDVTIDGQAFKGLKAKDKRLPMLFFENRGGRWTALDRRVPADVPIKRRGLSGPIDDAFMARFVVMGPSLVPWNEALDKYVRDEQQRFTREWDRYFRGTIRTVADAGSDLTSNQVLFGDPESNPLIAKVLPKLPITWTKEKLIVNGVEYDPKTHLPVMIYPNPIRENRSYVVLNSGHTFKEVDLKGTNALLYPRLGDWAVIKPTPTPKDPAAYEVVAAGLFDENWQFPKKK